MEYRGYAAYGFSDKAWKYGSDASLHLNKKCGLNLNASYLSDVTESGGVNFFDDKNYSGRTLSQLFN